MYNYKICIIGLGYVGLPLALLFSKKYKTIGFDVNSTKVQTIMSGVDENNELDSITLKGRIENGYLYCTSDINMIKDCNIFIIAVPTPVDSNNTPILAPLISASSIVGKVLKCNDIVIYESTVYPGVTEEICVPTLETESGLKYNNDFFVGYSPERINPGDKEHSVENILKITSGSTPKIAQIVDNLYKSVLKNGTYLVSSIKVAEAAKIIENAQRDVNIAFMNELAKIFNAMNIDTNEVIEAASTKWNFIKMKPGLVGGHCISVDPYYLIQKAQVYGVLPRIMSEARKLNDSMGTYIGNQVIKLMNKKGITILNSSILILGFTFKENCSDIRNTKVIDIYQTLSEYTDNIIVYDNHANINKVQKEYNINLYSDDINQLAQKFDTVILAVPHKELIELDITRFLRNKKDGIIYDVKSILPKDIVDGRL